MEAEMTDNYKTYIIKKPNGEIIYYIVSYIKELGLYRCFKLPKGKTNKDANLYLPLKSA